MMYFIFTSLYYRLHLRLCLLFCIFQLAGMLCKVSDGTALGMLKFASILPWEIDADIEIEGGNYTAYLDTIFPKLSKRGYKVVSSTLHNKYIRIYLSVSYIHAISQCLLYTFYTYNRIYTDIEFSYFRPSMQVILPF